MKKILFILCLIPQLVFSQAVINLSPDSTLYDLHIVQSYNANYQAVYDAFTTKPAADTSAFWNTMVGSIGTYWDSLDVFAFYAVHTNDNGEALLDWKQPAGGSEIITDGEFNTACGVNWVCGSGWSTGTGKAIATAATTNLQHVNVATVGKTYKITWTISQYTGGTARAKWNTNLGTLRSSAGTYTDILYCDDATLRIDGVTAFTGEISIVSVIEWSNQLAINSPTFTAYSGFTGDGTTTYINTRWNPFRAGLNFTQNSASLGMYIRTQNNLNEIDSRAYDGNNYVSLASDWAGDFYFITNSGSADVFTNGDSRGLWIQNRPASAMHDMYKNGSIEDDNTTASAGVPDAVFYVLGGNENGSLVGSTSRQTSCWFVGAGLSTTAITTITNAIEVCMDSMGKGVIP